APLISSLFSQPPLSHHTPLSFPTRRSSDLSGYTVAAQARSPNVAPAFRPRCQTGPRSAPCDNAASSREGPWRRRNAGCGSLSERSEEHTSELQSRGHLVCRLLLEKKNKRKK